MSEVISPQPLNDAVPNGTLVTGDDPPGKTWPRSKFDAVNRDGHPSPQLKHCNAGEASNPEKTAVT